MHVMQGLGVVLSFNIVRAFFNLNYMQTIYKNYKKFIKSNLANMLKPVHISDYVW